jgi:hypothetical protein
MITDVFHKRYARVFRFRDDGVPHQIQVFMRQAAQIIFQDLAVHVEDIKDVCKTAYGKLVRELGHGLTPVPGRDIVDTCINSICEQYNLWNTAHGSSEDFVAHRFSLVELLFATIERELTTTESKSKGLVEKVSEPTTSEDAISALRNAVIELNYRAREARIPFDFHNGLFQLTSDDATQSYVHKPFWQLVGDAKWHNIDMDIKEAIDRHDQKGRDVALYALKALESTIKIISDENGWSRGNERGAANYIDNLLSGRNGRFIEVWESNQLKALFSELRNPHGHGPGSAPQPNLSPEQEQWVIEISMIWIKSLVRRM